MFGKLFATLVKDLLLLWRDRAGLLVLFVMPAVLVVIITLVQNNVYKLMGETAARVILVDQDQGELGKQIIERMSRVEMVTAIAGETISEEMAIDLVAGGDFQAGIIIPAGTTSGMIAEAESEVRSSLTADTPVKKGAAPELRILFDPTVMGGFRSAMQNSLAMVLMEYEVRTKIDLLSRLLPEYVETEMKKSAGNFAEYIKVPPFDLKMSTDPILKVRAASASRDGLAVVPTPVQHNVPAWALFGMFFIVIPMAGSLIKERQEETLSRLMSMPVAYSVILAGKIIAFMLVCCAQFTLIYLLGRFVLPLLGLESFRLGPEWEAALIVVLAASLAATCYGIMLGTICKTYEQASMFGSISVVAASAIGGVMVPVYAMPAIMQKLSVISPIGWGLKAFLNIFIRGGKVSAVTGELSLLLLFSGATAFVAWLIFSRRATTGS
ncbi:MAG: ABC transporter permease [Proteobacteria bacterium]|nr:ABC transporter permease [Pseudomonadota bacterium]MBU1716720.1 ABC transporter permease [Pseudomonadota bacterium]